MNDGIYNIYLSIMDFKRSIYNILKKPDALFLFLENIDAVSIFKYFDVNIAAMLQNLDPDIVRYYICNINIKDFLLCQYVIYGPLKVHN
jgi:hypothetical protein